MGDKYTVPGTVEAEMAYIDFSGWWLLGSRFGAIESGFLTVGYDIIPDGWNGGLNTRTIAHEHLHFRQMLEPGPSYFLIYRLRGASEAIKRGSIMKGYWHIPWEKEARALEEAEEKLLFGKNINY